MVLVAGVSQSQHAGRVLHRPLPGDLTAEELSGPATNAPSTSASVARAAGAQTGFHEAQAVDPQVERPRAGWEAPSREMDRGTRSPPGTHLVYREVFTPSIQPFKRGSAMDMVDELGRLTVRDPALRPMSINSDPPAHWAQQRVAHFVGDTLIELTPAAPTPIAGVGGEQRILRYSTSDGEPLFFYEDGAGNWFVRAERSGTVRIQYAVEAPEGTFVLSQPPAMAVRAVAAAVPQERRPLLPSWLPAKAQRVLEQLGVSLDDPLNQVLSRLVGHFRAFRDADLPEQSTDLYTDLALGGVGACRHRAYALMLTLQAMGLPARYVGNEAHAWIELWLPERGWIRLDLGGWNVPLDTNRPSDRRQFEPPSGDAFPRPEGYEQQFSARANSASSHRADAGVWRESANPTDENNGPNSSRATAQTTAQALTQQALNRAASRAQAPDEALNAAAALTARVGTVTQITAVRADSQAGFASADGFVRGSMVRVSGSVHDTAGLPAAGLAVELQLMRRGHMLQSLGVSSTTEQGEFSSLVLLPSRIEAGEYALRAVTQADATRAGSTAE